MPMYLTTEQFAFIKYLTSLDTEQNRGTLAVLRRGLAGNPVEDLNLYRFIARHIPETDRGTKREKVYYLVAALYALQTESTGDGNFGKHMRMVAQKRNDMDAAERRFTALLTTPLQDLGTPLRRAVMMLKQNEQPVNWAALFADLLHWDHPEKYSQHAWANSFWAYESPSEKPTETQPAEI